MTSTVAPEVEPPPRPRLSLITPSPPSTSSDGSRSPALRPIVELNENLWYLGWVDGRLGQPAGEGEGLLQAEAELSRGNALVEVERRKAETESLLRTDQEAAHQSQKALADAREALAAVTAARSQKLQEYSLGLSLIFLLFSLLLFLSDIPLSLNLVATGYDLPTDARLPNGTEVRIAELFARPITVVRYLWEPLALALGIAFSGVFVKIFVAEVIWRESGRPSRKLVVFLGLVAALFVATLVAVGVFRAERQAADSATDEGYRAGWTVALPDGSSTVSDWASNQGDLESEDTPGTSGAGFWSFLLLTLMLPIIGGIAFEAGWLRLQNWQRHRECRRDVDRAQAERTGAEARISHRLGEMAALSAKIDGLKNLDAQVLLWQSLYRHGYQRGTGVPETMHPDSSLYERCEHLQVKQLAAEARKRFWAAKPS